MKQNVLKAGETNPTSLHNSDEYAAQLTSLKDVGTIKKSRYEHVEIFNHLKLSRRKPVPMLCWNKTAHRDKDNNIIHN